MVVKAFEAKGYLPYRDSSHWRAQWKHARYLATIVVSEKLEGNYLSSANRLTRIEVWLTVTATAEGSHFETSRRLGAPFRFPSYPCICRTGWRPGSGRRSSKNYSTTMREGKLTGNWLTVWGTCVSARQITVQVRHPAGTILSAAW